MRDADGTDAARHWDLDPDVLYLNHGSFGATPRVVLEEQARLRAEMEREPVQFLYNTFEERMDAARTGVAAFVGADPDDLAFVPNATTGVNTVLRSLRFAPGDELLVSDQEYDACRNAVDAVAADAGARVVVARLPFPVAGPDDVVESFVREVTPRTRFALIDHVTSQTGLVLPVERIARELAERGVDLMIDGAHAPGMVPLDIPAIGAAYYTGNCHKWLCAPKGAALLWVRRDRQDAVRPLVISHGWTDTRTSRSRFRLLFDWPGTHDPTPWLCVPAVIRFMGGLLPGGWDAVRARNHALALEARDTLCTALGIEPPAPDAMIGSTVALPLPDFVGALPAGPFLDPLQVALFEQHRIEVPVMLWPSFPRRLIRVSAQLYNSAAQYERLGEALQLLL